MTTQDAYSSIRSLSDLEVRLFSAPIAAAANTMAFVECVGLRPRRAANVPSLVPQPPKTRRLPGLVESVLLRAA